MWFATKQINVSHKFIKYLEMYDEKSEYCEWLSEAAPWRFSESVLNCSDFKFKGVSKMDLYNNISL